MNVEIVLNNTVNKTVIEFNYFIHNCLDTGNLANDEERLRRDGIIRRQPRYYLTALKVKWK